MPPLKMGTKGTSQATRKSDRRIGSLLIGATFVCCLGINLAAKRYALPEPPEAPDPPSSEGVEGWPGAVDAVASIAAARTRTERTHLRGFVARNVKPDGTLDATQPGSSVRYVFDSLPNQGRQPARQHGERQRGTYCGRQFVELSALGLGAAMDEPGEFCPTSLRDALPQPRCDLAQVWRAAQKEGAPATGLAEIHYYRAKAGPAWRFMSSEGFSLALYGDCSRVLKGADARGSVPGVEQR